MTKDAVITSKAGDREFKSQLREAALRGRRSKGERRTLWPAPYDQPTFDSRMAFLLDCIWTLLETEGEPEQIPDKEYIAWLVWHWGETRERGEPFVIWKPRRMIVSWVCRALELHDLGIFSGEHWLADENYKKSQQQVWRYSFLYDQMVRHLPHWGLPPLIPGVNTFGSAEQKQLDAVVLPNGSIFRAINSDPQALYGPGVRSITLEEPHTYAKLSDMLSQARMITQGRVGHRDGHVCLIGNSAPNSGWISLLKDEGFYPVPEGERFAQAPMYSRHYKGRDGILILDLRYQSDPEKDPAWVTKTRPGNLNWETEMEKRLDMLAGEPVFPQFSVLIHAPAKNQREPWLMDSHSEYVLGLDTGAQTIHHAGVLLEITPGREDRRQVIAVKEFVPDRPLSFIAFGHWCKAWIADNLPNSFWGNVIWVADHSITRREGSSLKTIKTLAWDELREVVLPISNVWETRKADVEWLLRDTVSSRDGQEEYPRFQLCAHDCPILFKALTGGYCYQSKPMSAYEDETIRAIMRRPEKGHVYSDVADSLQYACSHARELLRRQARKAA